MNNDVVIYQSSDGLVKMEAIVDASNETIWAQIVSLEASTIASIFTSPSLDW